MRKIQNVGEVPFEGGRMKDNDEVDTKKKLKKTRCLQKAIFIDKWGNYTTNLRRIIRAKTIRES